MNTGYSEALEKQIEFARVMARVASDVGMYGFADARRQLVEDGEAISERDVEWAQAAVLKTGASLRQAATYYWAPLMCHLLGASARTIPTNWKPALDSWPTPDGFCWFAAPLPDEVAEAPDDGIPLIALSWSVDTARNAVWVVLWGHAQYGRRFPVLQEYWPVGRSASQMAVKTHGSTKVAGWWYGVIAAVLALLEQRILTSHAQLAERHARKRIEREGWQHEPLIRVVELRRKERIGEKQPVEPVEHEWSCQWVVRGHWRQQFYPSKHANQPIWITPYVKGPEDKPLKPPRATVFAVVR